MFKNKKKCSILALLSLFLWGITFYTDTRLFSSDGLNMNCLPIDTAAVPFMHIMTKFFVLAAIFLFLYFITYAYNKPFLIFPVILFFVLYMVGLLLSYPGYFMNDDPIIFSYATRYYPVYWHNYLTSLFYMVGMSLIPASCGPIILSDLLFALTYGYITYETHKLFTTRLHYIILILGILPCTLLAALMPFRPCLYTSFHLFFFAWLTFQYLKKITPSFPKLIGLAFLSALLAFWRSEGIILLVFAPILLILVFGKEIHKGQVITFLIAMLAFFTIIKIPQSLGESKYYGSDYLIISTTRPLSVIVHRDQTYNGAAEDLTNINAVTDFG